MYSVFFSREFAREVAVESCDCHPTQLIAALPIKEAGLVSVGSYVLHAQGGL